MRPAAVLALLLLAGGTARAQDAYEIQVYAADLLAPGTIGTELHLNHARGADLATHLTLEPHLGLAPWLEVGMYFTSVFSADGRYDFTGVKARVKVGLPQRLGPGLGLALNTELSFGGGSLETGQGMEFRPIVDLDLPFAYFAVNPIITLELGGPVVVGFEPCVKAAAKLGEVVQLGLEYYGGLELAGPTAPPAATHRLFAAVDLAWKVGAVELSVNAGAGYGFTGPERWLFKTILGVDVP